MLKASCIEIPFRFDFEDVLIEYEYSRAERPSLYSPGEPEQAHISAVSLQGRMGPRGRRERFEVTGFLDADAIFELERAVIDYEREERGQS